ncbi:MAG: dihydropteroate synthase [Nocardioidaceae bacterium]
MTPERLVVGGRARAWQGALARRDPRSGGGRVVGIYQHVPFRAGRVVPRDRRTHQRRAVRSCFARRCSSSGWDDCVEIARGQIRDGAHLLDLGVRLRRPGRCRGHEHWRGCWRRRHPADRAASTLPTVLDSTEPAVLQAGLERLAGRSVIELGQLRGR